MVSNLYCGLSKARWVDWHQLHLTLRFIGPVDGAMFCDIKESMEGLEAPSFELQLSGVGQFSAKGANRQQRHVLWVGCSSPPELFLLHKKIEDRLREVGLPQERRSFSPHITLARLEGQGDERLANYLQTFANFSTPPFRVEEVTLYHSDHSKGEVCYVDDHTTRLIPLE